MEPLLLLKNIRFYVLIFSSSLAAFYFYYLSETIPEPVIQQLKLTQYFALTALAFLYLALLIGPLVYTFRNLPFKNQVHKARRAIGVSAFIFALFHAYFGFFTQLGGPEGLSILSNDYLIAVSLGSFTLFVLFLMAATSFDFIVRKMTFKRWKLLHRLVYLAAFATIFHALMLGSHFQDLSGLIPQIAYFAILLLWVLEGLRIDNNVRNKFRRIPKGLTFFLFLLIFAAFTYYGIITRDLSFGIHSEHLELVE